MLELGLGLLSTKYYFACNEVILMIDGTKIKEARKIKKLSQKDLAEGITTQATISLLERNGVEPSGTVLALLLNRLDLNLTDILIDEKSSINVKNKLKEAEICCMRYEYETARDILLEIKDYITDDLKTQFLFLDTNVKMWLDYNFDDAIFSYNIIIQQNREDIYSLLALCELGVAYAKNALNDKANYYFGQVEKKMKLFNLDRTPFWTLFLYDNLSKYFSNEKKYEQCLTVLTKAESFAKKLNVVFFLEQIYFLFATTLRDINNGWTVEALNYLIQSQVFASFFDNKKVLAKTSRYLNKNPQLIAWSSSLVDCK